MKRIYTGLFLTAFLFSGNVFAQQKPIHEVYSMMVYNFMKYIQWPNDGNGEFVIGIAGNNNMLETMGTWYNGSKMGTRTCVIKKIQSPADVEGCQVVFLDKSKSGEFEAIQNRMKGKSALLITDKNGLGVRGSAINFKVVDSKLKFEMNQKVLESANLKVAGALTSMAILI
ncbi:MAG TPA: YfiR family protein [Cyclobacteriaceae bacterium]|nr:YfiR family protein [Cyclobacteriaceae bacterium]